MRTGFPKDLPYKPHIPSNANNLKRVRAGTDIGTMVETFSTSQQTLLKRAHLVAGVLHLTSAIVLLVLGLNNGDTWRPVLRASYEVWTRNNDCDGAEKSNEGDCFDLERAFLKVDSPHIIALLFLFGFWSGLVHLITVIRWEDFMTRFKNRTNIGRWIDYAVSSTLMIIVIAIYAGIDDVNILVGVAVSQFITICLGALSEYSHSNGILFGEGNPAANIFNRAKWLLYALANVIFVVGVWAPILTTFAISIDKIPSDADVDRWLIYLIFSAFAVVFSSFGFVFLAQIGWKKRISYGKVELLYVVLSLTSKVLLHWVLYFALFQRSATLSNEAFTASGKLDLDEGVLLPVIIGVVSTGVLGAIFVLVIWSHLGNASTGKVTAKAGEMVKTAGKMRSFVLNAL